MNPLYTFRIFIYQFINLFYYQFYPDYEGHHIFRLITSFYLTNNPKNCPFTFMSNLINLYNINLDSLEWVAHQTNKKKKN